MKKLKLLILTILITTLCTGCTIEYNINITNDKIIEEINVTDTILNNRSKNDILTHYNMWYPTYVNFIKEGETIEIEGYDQKIDNIEYHNKNINEIDNGYKYTYKYTYPIEKYYDSYVLATTFIESTVHNNSETLVLRTSKENLLCQYDYFESVKVNINIDPEIYELNYTNSTNINNNTYTWILDKNNCNDSQVILTLNKKDLNIQSSSPTVTQRKEKNYMLYIFLVGILIIVFIGYKLFMKFKDKNNGID